MPRGRERGVRGRGSRGRRAKIGVALAVIALFALAAAVDGAEAAPDASSPQPQQPPPAPPPKKSNGDGARSNKTVVVRDPASLRAALEDQSVADVLIGGNGDGEPTGGGDLDIDNHPSWPRDGPPVVLTSGRTVVLRSADRSNPSSLNFSGGPTPAIVVSKNATLVLSQLLVTAAKPPSQADANKPGKGIAEHYAAPELGSWPSISLEPGAEFGLVNSTNYVYGGCEAISSCLTARAPGGGLRPGVVPNAQTLVPADNNVTMLLRPGFLDCGMPIVANRTGIGAGTVVGAAHVFYDDSVSVCTQGDHPRVAKNPAALPIPEPMKRTIEGILRRPRPPSRPPGDGGSLRDGRSTGGAPKGFPLPPRSSPPSSKWWIALVIAGAVALAVASVVLGLFASRRRHRRGGGGGEQVQGQQKQQRGRRGGSDVESGGGKGGGGRTTTKTEASGSSPFDASLLSAGADAATRQRQQLRVTQQQQQRAQQLQRSSSLSPPASPRAAAASLLDRTASGGASSALARSVISISRGGGGDGRVGSDRDSDRGGGGGGGEFERTVSGDSLLGASSAAFASAWHALRIGTPDVGEAVEVGPVIGRGSFGVVMKGRWHGALVALKVIHAGVRGAGGISGIGEGILGGEAGAGGGGATAAAGDDEPSRDRGAEARVARESLLAVSLSHPNVVPTHRICFVAPPRRSSVDEREWGDEDEEEEEEEEQEEVVSPRATAAAAAPAAAAEASAAASSPRSATTSPFSRAPSPPPPLADASASTPLGPWMTPEGAAERERQQQQQEEQQPKPNKIRRRSSRRAGGGGGRTPHPVTGTKATTTTSELDTESASRPHETWLIMEYADRGSLDDAIRANRFRVRAPRATTEAAAAAASASVPGAVVVGGAPAAPVERRGSGPVASGVSGDSDLSSPSSSSSFLLGRARGGSAAGGGSRAARTTGAAAAAAAAAAASSASANSAAVTSATVPPSVARAAAAASAATDPDCGDGSRFDLASALRCLLDIAAGVDYLHAAGVVHGDLKPTNVLLKSAAPGARGGGGGGGAFFAPTTADAAAAASSAATAATSATRPSSLPQADSPLARAVSVARGAARRAALEAAGADPRSFTCKLCDFGLSRLVDATVQTHVSTLHYGTIAYQPPEVLRTGRMSRASDSYAFGLIALEVATGEKPFAGAAIGQVVYGVIYAGARPEIPDWLPRRYADLVRACWSAEAAQRPTFSEILRELGGMLREALAAGAEAAAEAAARVVVEEAARARTEARAESDSTAQQQQQQWRRLRDLQQQQQRAAPSAAASSSAGSGATSGGKTAPI